MSKKFEKNKKGYMFYCILKQSLFIWSISLIYLRGIGLSFTEIMLLESISAVVTFIFEIPSGIMADIFNRKKLIVYGEVLNLIGLIIILLFKNFYIIIGYAILCGIGNALISGADEALIYDSFEKNNKQDLFKEYLSKVQMWSLRLYAITTLFAGALYKINQYIPIVLSILIQTFSIICILGVKEVRVSRETKRSLKSECKNQIDNIKEILTNRKLIKLFYMYIVMMVVISNINYISQSFLIERGIDYTYMGVVFFIFNIISSFGAKYAANIKLNNIYIMFIYGILLIGLCFSNLYIALAIFVISRFINGMVWPILNADINDKIKSENRATILSYKSLFIQISFIIFDPLIGVSLDKFNMSYTYGLMGITLLVIIIITIVIKLINKKREGYGIIRNS